MVKYCLLNPDKINAIPLSFILISHKFAPFVILISFIFLNYI